MQHLPRSKPQQHAIGAADIEIPVETAKTLCHAVLTATTMARNIATDLERRIDITFNVSQR
jgi:hypothetical protein